MESANLFQYSSASETGLLDFHYWTVTEFKMEFKTKQKITAYRECKHFDNTKFRYDIITATANAEIWYV